MEIVGKRERGFVKSVSLNLFSGEQVNVSLCIGVYILLIHARIKRKKTSHANRCDNRIRNIKSWRPFFLVRKIDRFIYRHSLDESNISISLIL